MTYVDPEDTTVSYGFLGRPGCGSFKDDVTEFAVDKQEAKKKKEHNSTIRAVEK